MGEKSTEFTRAGKLTLHTPEEVVVDIKHRGVEDRERVLGDLLGSICVGECGKGMGKR